MFKDDEKLNSIEKKIKNRCCNLPLLEEKMDTYLTGSLNSSIVEEKAGAEEKVLDY